MTEVTKRRIPTPIDDRRFNFADQKVQRFVVDAEDGTEIEDVLDPGYWANEGKRLQRFDHIEVRHELGLWMAEFLVLECDTHYAKLKLLQKYVLEAQAPEEDNKLALHRIEHKGTVKKWTVIRNKDNAEIQDGFNSKHQAREYLNNYEKVTA